MAKKDAPTTSEPEDSLDPSDLIAPDETIEIESDSPTTSDPTFDLTFDAARTAVTENPDGTLSSGIGPDAVIQHPDNAPPPINPLTGPEDARKRILYENFINAEAEAFAASAKDQFIEARLQGLDIEIVTSDPS